MASLNNYCTETEAASILGYNLTDFRRLMAADMRAPRETGIVNGEATYLRALVENYREARASRDARVALDARKARLATQG